MRPMQRREAGAVGTKTASVSARWPAARRRQPQPGCRAERRHRARRCHGRRGAPNSCHLRRCNWHGAASTATAAQRRRGSSHRRQARREAKVPRRPRWAFVHHRQVNATQQGPTVLGMARPAADTGGKGDAGCSPKKNSASESGAQDTQPPSDPRPVAACAPPQTVRGEDWEGLAQRLGGRARGGCGRLSAPHAAPPTPGMVSNVCG